jgi:hypothetical protein
MVVGEPGKPKKKKSTKTPQLKLDSRAVPAGAIISNDAFGAWEAELAKFGFAIIHNKIVVIDPFSDNCSVVTGSHNLGFRASHNNDENMVIIHGHRGLAQAYACHVLDLYDHYAWRFFLKAHPEVFGKPLQPDDTWQERYIRGADEKSPELRFWLSAATGGHASSGTATRPKPAKKAATKVRTKKSVKRKPAQKKTVKKTAKKKMAKQRSPDKRVAKQAVKKKPRKKKAWVLNSASAQVSEHAGDDSPRRGSWMWSGAGNADGGLAAKP